MFKNEHELSMPVLFDSCLRYDSCQSSFKREAVCYKQITLLSVKGENQPETLMGLGAKRVGIQASLNSEFPDCFLRKRLFCFCTSQWHKAVNSVRVGWSNCALDVWDPSRSLMWPMKALYSLWILSIIVVLPVCSQGAGVLSIVCTRMVLLGEFRGISWKDFSWIPQTLLLGKWEGQRSTCQVWVILMQKGGARTDHWERWWLWGIPRHVLRQGQEGWKAGSSTVLILLRQKQRWMTGSGSAVEQGLGCTLSEPQANHPPGNSTSFLCLCWALFLSFNIFLNIAVLRKCTQLRPQRGWSSHSHRGSNIDIYKTNHFRALI